MKVSLLLPLLLLLLLLVLVVVTSPVSAGRSRFLAVEPRAMSAIVRIQKDLSREQRSLTIPKHLFPYYQRPRYRYPFYNQHGDGQLLYGYGDKHLYSYSKFKTIDGYSKRR